MTTTRWCVCALALSGVLRGELAQAQDSQAELARRDLITRAEVARRAGHFAEALTNATRAAQIRETPSLRLLLAQSHNALGHVLEALEQSRACVREAEADVALRNRALVMSGCQEIATQLEPRVGRLTIHVHPSVPPGLRVRVGETDMNAALVDVAFPVMPGRLTVRGEATGYRAFEGNTEVLAGRNAEITVRMELVPEAARVRDTPHPIGDRGASEVHSGPGAGPWVFMGVGGAGLIAGAVFAGLAQSEVTRRETVGCLPQNQEAICENAMQTTAFNAADDARGNYQLAQWISLGVGGGAAVSGLLWLLLSPSHTASQGRAGLPIPFVISSSSSTLIGFEGSF